VSNYSSGHQAEKIASEYLIKQNFEILSLNWSTPVCEIDIIAKKNNTIYFVEVKYRKNNSQGTGLDYITPKKLKQMDFAASCWIKENNYSGHFELSAIEMYGEYQVSEFIEELT
jgi:putative endonuclease